MLNMNFVKTIESLYHLQNIYQEACFYKLPYSNTISQNMNISISTLLIYLIRNAFVTPNCGKTFIVVVRLLMLFHLEQLGIFYS